MGIDFQKKNISDYLVTSLCHFLLMMGRNDYENMEKITFLIQYMNILYINMVILCLYRT